MFGRRMIRSRCVSIVRTPIPSLLAISLLLWPSAISTSTSRSRLVSWAKGSFLLREDLQPKQFQYVVMDCPSPRMIGAKGTAIYKLDKGVFTLTGYAPGDPNIPPDFDAPGARHFEFKKPQ